jgi:hypothetical protein
MRRKVLVNLKSMLSFAQGQGFAAQNVARGVKIKADDRRAASGPLREGRPGAGKRCPEPGHLIAPFSSG